MINEDMNLWELSTEVITQYDEILNTDPETGEIISEEERNKRLKELIVNKADGCFAYLNRKEALAEMARQRADDLYAYASARANEVKKLKEYIKTCMEKMKVDVVEGTLQKFRLKMSPGKCVVSDEKAVPMELLVYDMTPPKPTYNLNEVKKYVEKNPIPGIAIVKEKYLQIDIKK